MKNPLLAALLIAAMLQGCGYDYFVRKYGTRRDSTKVSIPYSQKIEGITDAIEVPRGTLTFDKVTGSKGAKLSASQKIKLNPLTGRIDTLILYKIVCPDTVATGTAQGKAATQIVTEDKPGFFARAYNGAKTAAFWLLLVGAALYAFSRFFSVQRR